MGSTFSLTEIKTLAEQRQVIITKRAINEAEKEYGFGLEQIIGTIQELNDRDFDRTITSHTTGRKNDVYLKSVYSPVYRRVIQTYIKLEIKGGLMIISFHSSL